MMRTTRAKTAKVDGNPASSPPEHTRPNDPAVPNLLSESFQPQAMSTSVGPDGNNTSAGHATMDTTSNTSSIVDPTHTTAPAVEPPSCPQDVNEPSTPRTDPPRTDLAQSVHSDERSTAGTDVPALAVDKPFPSVSAPQGTGATPTSTASNNCPPSTGDPLTVAGKVFIDKLAEIGGLPTLVGTCDEQTTVSALVSMLHTLRTIASCIELSINKTGAVPNFMSLQTLQALAMILSGAIPDDAGTTRAAPTMLAPPAVPTATPAPTVSPTSPSLPTAWDPRNAPTSTDAPAEPITTVPSRFVDDPSISAAFGVYDNHGPHGPNTAQLSEKLDNVRAVARERNFYVASGPDVIKRRVTWFEDGNGHIIVDKTLGVTTMDARAAHAAEPLTNPKPPVPDLAHLYIIGTIASTCCFLHCDGNFRKNGPSAQFSRGFAGTTLTCALVAPPPQYPALVNDYVHGKATVCALADHFGVPRTGLSFKPQDIQEDHLRLRHKPFQVRLTSLNTTLAALPAEFQMATWPVNDDAKPHRDALVKTHITKPLAAFDVNANLISPSMYVPELKGATVLAGISLLEYHINGVHNICLDIQYMRVLIPGPGEEHAAQKRSAIEMTDPFSRACEKRRAL
ncbi:hypothetical protein V8D89_013675 [Ganoderma adspersum]